MGNSYTRNGLGPHAALIKGKLPGWIKHIHVNDIKRLSPGLASRDEPPEWFTLAPRWLRQALIASQDRSRRANTALAKTLGGLQGITEFAEPRLKEALHSHSAAGQAMDVNKNRLFYLRRNQPVQHQSLLQAALMNFEGNEAFSLAVNGQVSALAPEGALPLDVWTPVPAYPVSLQIADVLVRGLKPVISTFKQAQDNLKPVPGFRYREKLAMTPQVFSQICRALDLGQQYQDHLSEVFDAPNRASSVRHHLQEAQKALLAVHLHAALMQQHVSTQAYDMVRAVLDGDPGPMLNAKPVVFSQLQLYGFTLDQVLIMGPYRSTLPVTEWVDTDFGVQLPVMKKPDMERLVVWIPGAPLYPLKEYPSLEAFQYELGLNLRTPAYQELFAQRVPQGDAQAFVSRLNHQLYRKTPDPKGKEAPVYVDEVDLKLGQAYIEPRPGELFTALYDLHLERLKANARLLAVPTADADSALLQQRLDYWLGLGMDAVNVAAFFIPGVGEVMMAVMALQMGMEIYHGIESWSVGDVEGAWAHLQSVAINVGLAGAMGGAGYGVGKIPTANLSKWSDKLTQIILPNAQTRLWMPDLGPYECDVTFGPQVKPNALGQYLVDGKTWVRIDRHVYEQTFDPALKAWRIKHPTDSTAYQPLLKHNDGGAWRHHHEQPLQWPRETLLRRLGHETEAFDDQILAQIGDVSGISDDELRKIHIDGLPVPAVLMDTLEQFGLEHVQGRLGDQPVNRSNADLDWLRRRHPMLTERTAREVLEQVGQHDLARLRETRQVPGKIDDLARALAQQGRLNRALAGLYRQSLASLDSERLALHCRALLPGISGAELPQAIGRYATSHRSEMARVLKLRMPKSSPRLQKLNGQIGYPLSGRGEVSQVDASLVSRMRDVYPNMTDQEVSHYLLRRLDEGQSDQQIYHFLTTQKRELDTLRTALDQWVGGARDAFSQRMRRHATDRLVTCWREGLLRNGEPSSYLNLEFDLGWVSDYPVLEADFSHVRTLKLDTGLMLSEPQMGFVKRFSGVQRLEMNLHHSDQLRVAEGLSLLPAVKELSLDAGWQGFSQLFINRLQTVPQIERLSLTGPVGVLDVSGWPQLRALRLAGTLGQWPLGLFELEHLDVLDLSGSIIESLPEQLFSGHPRVWRGLRLEWSKIHPRAVRRAYEYLRDNPGHLMDVEQWIAGYCQGCLKRFIPHNQPFAERVVAQFALREQGMTELFGRVNTLHEENQALNVALDAWLSSRPLTADVFFRRQVVDKIQHCWSLGISRRLGFETVSAGPSWRHISNAGHLDLSGGRLEELPQLPESGFAHVQHLDLNNLGMPLDVLDRFLGSFANVHVLNLSRNGLTSLPTVLRRLTRITDLDLTYNELTVTPSMQGLLDCLGELKKLSLQGNRVTALDVSAMTRLESLDLSHSAIKQWPAGVLQLPQLRQLNMSRSAITDIPAAGLQGHEDLMSGTQLRGCRLTPESCARLLAYAQRTGRQSAGDISPFLLATGRTGGSPEFFPEEVSDNPELLLPGRQVSERGDSPVTPAALLQRLNPDLALSEAIDRIEQIRGQGVGALQIDAQLLEWSRQHDGLILRLNRWIDMPSYREGGRWVSAVDRRRAADRIIRSWRHTLGAEAISDEDEIHTLDFSDLCLGDLPQLDQPLAHVTTLNLNGVRLSAQGSNGFISGFTGLHTLRLNNNALSHLPDAVGSLGTLTRLEACYNQLEDAEHLHHQLQSLTRLEWLDLNYNRLENFDLTGLNRLHTLLLRGNRLVRWPMGVLNTPTLRNLNLSNNQIEYIPVELFDGDNDELMASTDLTDNLLSASGFSELRDYLDLSGNSLGYDREDIESALREEGEAVDSSDESDEDLVHPSAEPQDQQKARWFENIPADSPRHGVWDALRAEEGSEGLFHLLAQLKHSRDFIQDKADLARRVWSVLEAGEMDSMLRNELFIIARSPMTCGDGRILLFSDLEVKVHEFNALRSVVPGAEGPVLLKLATGLFRLGQVEEISRTDISLHPERDPAEIRLAYRIGLAKRLDLPKQPTDMLFRNASGVTDQDIDTACSKVLAAQNSPLLMEQLISQDYWVSYLQRKYASAFSRLELRYEQEAEALQDQHPELDEAYSREIVAMGERRKIEQRALLTRLSQRERDEIAPV